LRLGHALQQGHQAGPGVHGAVPVAGLELRIQHQAQVADPVGVHAMDTKGNFEFERTAALCRSAKVLDMRRKK
jgi:hypothetical protein